jgi:catechol 2,3-dioxygenase
MSPSLQLRSLHLRVSDLARSVDFYAGKLGFVVRDQRAGEAELATSPTGPALLTLTEDRAALAPPPEAAGLFHAALLLPTRAALGQWLQHAADAGVSFDGFSDHGVSEAIYLSDPDGNGLEFYADRPRETWPRRGAEIAMGTEPLAVPDLLAAGARDPAVNPPLTGATWGHLHLRVTNLDRSEKFYSETLGVTLTQRYGTSARFLAADGYHHHLGLNTWGHPSQPHPQTPPALGLIDASFVRTAATAGHAVRDPDGIAVRIFTVH